MTHRRFVLLDRDGTIIVQRHYLSTPEDVELLPRCGEGLRALRAMGFGLAVITNQSGIGRGYFDEHRLREIHRRMDNLLASEDIVLDGIYYCPHTPEARCSCRKPATGLALAAAAEHGFDPRSCFVIGDKRCDIELGRNLAAKSILVRTGYGDEVAREEGIGVDHICNDLAAAACTIAEYGP